MRNFIIAFIIIVLCLIGMDWAWGQVPCQGSGCAGTTATMSNEIQVDHSQVLYYNNNGKTTTWAYPHSPHRVMLPQYYIDAPKGPKYQPLLNVVQFHMTFDLAQLKKMLKGEKWFKADVDLDVTPLVDKIKEDDPKRTYVITVMFPVKGIGLPKAKLLAQISGRADDPDDATSLQVFAAMLLKAMEYGANAVYMTGEGTERILTADGWGIGASHVYASVNESGGNGNTSSGGIGYSAGKTKYEDQPYLQLNALRANTYSMHNREKKIRKMWKDSVKLDKINQELEIRRNGNELQKYKQIDDTAKKSLNRRVNTR